MVELIINILALWVLLLFERQYPVNDLHKKNLTVTWPLNSLLIQISFNKLLRALHEFIEVSFDEGTHKHIIAKKGGSNWTSQQNDPFVVFDKKSLSKGYITPP